MTADSRLAAFDLSAAGRRAMRRYEQGASHARQGRTDLLGICPDYDAGFDAADGQLDDATWAAAEAALFPAA